MPNRHTPSPPPPDVASPTGACSHRHAHQTPPAGSDERGRAAGGLSRRTLLTGAATLVVGATAGCLGGGDGGETPAAVTLTDDDTCDVCGMVIPQHPGPTAEIFYDRDPSGHPNPARFDSTWEAFQYDFERRDRGWTRRAFYVTDYSAVDYELFSEGGDTFVSTHTEAEAFAAAESVTFVVDSEVIGAMGRDLIGFGDRADAESFRAEHGGSLVGLDDVTPEMIAQLGMG